MHTLNNDIQYDTLKVLHHENGFIGEMKKDKAMHLADTENVDLILTNEKSNPPTCVMQDYGKFMYEMKKKEKKHKQKQNTPSIKEIKFRPTTDDHDLGIKAKQVQKFIDNGNIVRIKVVMTGRENSHRYVATETFNKFLGMISNYVVDVGTSTSGNTISTQIKGA